MRSARIALAVMGVILAVTALGAQIAPPIDPADRVRAALNRPPSKLTLTEVVPDFTVQIEKRRPMQDIFDIPPWQLDHVGWQPPGIGLDMSALFRYIAKAKYHHDERVAHDGVQRDIADYCAAQPNRATITICSNAPSAR